SRHPDVPDVPEIRLALQGVVAQTLRSLTAWMGPLLLAFAPLDYFFSPPPSSHALAILDLVLGLAFIAMHLLVRSGRVHPRMAHSAMGIVVLAVLPYLWANLIITGDPVQSAGWAIWQICLGLVLLSWPWLLVLLGLSDLLWGLTVVYLPSSPAWQQYTFVLATSNVIAVVAHGVRLRTIRHLEGLRLEERGQREELERVQVTAREVETVRQVNEAKTRFINTAAHELSTPMTPIVLQLAMLRKGGQANLTARQARSIAILERNVGRLNALLQDVLDSARLQSDRFALSVVPLDLAALLAQCVADHEDAARAAGVKIHLDSPPLPAEGDPNRLAQVLGNLLGNALKFTPRGGGIQVTGRRMESGFRVEVEDSGIGLPAQELPRLFQPFAQVRDPRTAAVTGTGLGLYISKGIVEHHGGSIGCSSLGLGKGSTFWFTLPGKVKPSS
ncbi:MAG: HAMP domain-containing histidine kinase, partial [Halobacteriales archaeon]|nr:HAMP domain-containing histidine kinase [Halobacteriales archaeon]